MTKDTTCPLPYYSNDVLSTKSVDWLQSVVCSTEVVAESEEDMMNLVIRWKKLHTEEDCTCVCESIRVGRMSYWYISDILSTLEWFPMSRIDRMRILKFVELRENCDEREENLQEFASKNSLPVEWVKPARYVPSTECYRFFSFDTKEPLDTKKYIYFETEMKYIPFLGVKGFAQLRLKRRGFYFKITLKDEYNTTLWVILRYKVIVKHEQQSVELKGETESGFYISFVTSDLTKDVSITLFLINTV